MKKINKVGTILMFVLFLIFFCYGVYMAIYSIEYLTTYTATSAVTVAGAFQYIMTSCISYFGFGFVFLAAALILHSLDGASSKKQSEPLTVDIPQESSISKSSKSQPEEAAKSSDAPIAVPTAGKVVAAPLASKTSEIADEAAAEIAAVASEADAGKPIETDSIERIEMDPASAAGLAEELSTNATDEHELFEVEYIYNEEPADINEELDSIDKIPSIEELSREIENELPADIEEEISLDIIDEIPIELPSEASNEIPIESPAQNAEDTQANEQESFRITSDFIKDILESK